MDALAHTVVRRARSRCPRPSATPSRDPGPARLDGADLRGAVPRQSRRLDPRARLRHAGAHHPARPALRLACQRRPLGGGDPLAARWRLVRRAGLPGRGATAARGACPVADGGDHVHHLGGWHRLVPAPPARTAPRPPPRQRARAQGGRRAGRAARGGASGATCPRAAPGAPAAPAVARAAVGRAAAHRQQHPRRGQRRGRRAARGNPRSRPRRDARHGAGQRARHRGDAPRGALLHPQGRSTRRDARARRGPRGGAHDVARPAARADRAFLGHPRQAARAGRARPAAPGPHRAGAQLL